MQFPSDTSLANALKPGQKRYFGVSLKFDWLKNGLYNDTLSDLSGNFEGGNIQRELAGVIPAELQETEGFSGAQLTVTLSGNVSDGTPIWKVFSPMSGYGIYGTGGAVNTPMTLDVIAIRDDGTHATIRQFTGWVDSSTPSRADGTVTVICFDAIGQLENAITQYRWGCDSYLREVVLNLGGTASGELKEAGTGAMDWMIDDILRRSGFFEGPAWHPNAIAAWTLRGSTLPGIGTIMQEYPTVYQDVWNFGNMTWATPMISPAMSTPGDVWSKAAGKYGPAFKGLNSLGLWNGATRAVNYLTGSAQATDRYEVATYGGTGHNLLGASCWVFVDTTQANSPISDTVMYLSAMTKDYGVSGQQYPAYARMAFRQDTGLAVWQIQQEGNGAAQHQWTAPALTNGWHFISWVADFTASVVLSSCWVDGVLVINNTNGGTAGSVGTFTYPWWDNTTNCVTVSCELAMQYVQWIEGRNQLLASYVQPVSTPTTDPRFQAKTDLAGQRLHWLPDINQEAARDVLQAAVGADLGVLYASETGPVTFDSRATVKGRQLAANAVIDLNLDVLEELAPSSTYASVANKIGYTSTLWTAVPYSNIYAAQQADQFLIPPGTFEYPVTLSNVQSIRCGQVTYRPFAQGYDSGLSPPTLYYQNYMDYYKPAYWQDGFTGYLPNSRPSNGPPPVQSGMNCYAIPGWVSGYTDQNSRHMKIRAVNGSGTDQREFAVDDGTPFLNIAGTLLMTRPSVTESITDATSIARYKERIYTLPTDDWHQDILWLRSVAASLLLDTKNPQVQFDTMTIPGDPRLQLQDVARIVDPDLPGSPGMTGATVAYGSIVAITRDISGSGGAASISDTLTVRTFT